MQVDIEGFPVEEVQFLHDGETKRQHLQYVNYYLTIAARGLFDGYHGGVIHTRVLAIDRRHFPILDDAEEVWLVFDHSTRGKDMETIIEEDDYPPDHPAFETKGERYSG